MLRRLRFSLRDMFVVTAFVAVVLAAFWQLAAQRRRHEHDLALERAKTEAAWVEYSRLQAEHALREAESAFRIRVEELDEQNETIRRLSP